MAGAGAEAGAKRRAKMRPEPKVKNLFSQHCFQGLCVPYCRLTRGKLTNEGRICFRRNYLKLWGWGDQGGGEAGSSASASALTTVEG